MVRVDLLINQLPMQIVPANWSGGFWWHWLFFTVVIIVFVLMMVMGVIYIERRAMGRMQSRLGPNRTGPFGLLQPVADAIKVMMKEDIVPAAADKVVHFLAPILIFVPVMLMFAVIPIQEGVGLIPDLNVGVLFLVAVGSIETIAVFMAGWGSNNKYSVVGAMRSVAMMVSYEMPMAFALLAVVLVAVRMRQESTQREIDALRRRAHAL